MRQFQFGYKGQDSLVRELRKISQWSRTKIYSRMVFQVFIDIIDREAVEKVMDTIKDEIPDALIFGCSTNGHIINGELSGRTIAITCTVFEYPTSRVQILQYDLNEENEKLKKKISNKMTEGMLMPYKAALKKADKNKE